MMISEHDYDVVISGGGLAGASLACALGPSKLKIALVETKDFDGVEQTSFDTRYIALTYGTGLVFRNLHIWDELEEGEATEIRQIEVTGEDRRGLANLTAKDAGVEVLGWNVQARALGVRLVRRIRQLENVSILSPAKIADCNVENESVRLSVAFADETWVQPISAKVLVIADGGGSELRNQLGFAARLKPYTQQALISRVITDKPHRGMAYEHFRNSGPIALLPIAESEYSIVWTLEPTDIERLKSAAEKHFLAELKNHFGDRVGTFQKLSGARVSYPLTLSQLRKFVRPRLVVVGNASHTVHPVAGQGFNLTLRDVAGLADVLDNYNRWGWDIGNYDVLTHYESWRLRESNAVATLTDGLIRSFANQNPVFTAVRNLGLNLVGSSPAIRHMLLIRTMGMYGKQSQLVSES